MSIILKHIMYEYCIILYFTQKNTKMLRIHYTNNAISIRLLICGRLRPQNIYWQDWKYTHRLVKTSTSQCNVQRWTCCGRRQKHWIESPIFKLIFNPFTLHWLYRFYYQTRNTVSNAHKIIPPAPPCFVWQRCSMASCSKQFLKVSWNSVRRS